MEINLGTPLLLTGAGLFVVVLIFWWFFLYPRRKRFLNQLEKSFNLKCSKRALTIRESQLKGFYQDYPVKISPFTGGKDSWILLKCSNPQDLLAVIKPRKPLKLFRDPISLLWNRREFFTRNVAFDTKFRVLATTTFSINKIISSSIQEDLIQLVKKREFEIQILWG